MVNAIVTTTVVAVVAIVVVVAVAVAVVLIHGHDHMRDQSPLRPKACVVHLQDFEHDDETSFAEAEQKRDAQVASRRPSLFLDVGPRDLVPPGTELRSIVLPFEKVESQPSDMEVRPQLCRP